MGNEKRGNRAYQLRIHLFGWMLAAFIVGLIEGTFCFFVFDNLPVSEITTAILTYMSFGIALGIITSFIPLSSAGGGNETEHKTFSLITATLVFVFVVIIVRRTQYLLTRIGLGAGLLAVAILIGAGAFILMASLSRKARKPLSFFVSLTILLMIAFLLLRFVNHYKYDSAFYQPPAIYFNGVIFILFFPFLSLSYRFFAMESVERAIITCQKKAVIAVLLLITLLIFLFGSVSSHISSGQTQTPNILLIVMDTTRSDRLSCYGYKVKTSPNIDALASEGVLFKEAIASGPWTLPTHSSMFTGLYPSSHGAHWEHMYLDSSLNTAAELLSRKGYQTVGFSNNGIVSRATNMSQGFDDYYEMWKSETLSPLIFSQIKDILISTTGRRDAGARRTNQLIRGWFERTYDAQRPFFMFVNYLEAHLVYNPPIDFRRRFVSDSDVVSRMRKVNIHTLYRLLVDMDKGEFPLSREEIDVLRSLYDAEIAYLDSRIGELIEYLRASGILQNTFLIITSDHGENIGEHNLIDHQLCLYDTLLRVPLILRHPTLVRHGIQVDETVQSVDIFPTLLDVAGVNYEEVGYPLQGTSLLDILAGGDSHRYAFSEYMSPRIGFRRVQNWAIAKGSEMDLSRFDRRLKSIRSDTLKYIWASDGEEELFKLSSDPFEEFDLGRTDTGSVKFMRKKLDEWHSSLPILVKEGTEIPEMDRETRELLKALGYID
ncbi:MAG: sulfatase [Candidatus Glassbacteria bacterium]